MTGLFTPTDDNATETLYALLQSLKVPVTRATVRAELPLHPDFPSLLSLSELLTDWKIENMAVQLNTVEQLRELPIPFIAHLRKKNGWYVLVTKIAGDTITYTDSSEGRCTEPMANFERQWSGVALLAEADEQAGEPDYKTNRKHERLNGLRNPFLLAGASLIFLFVILSVAKELTAPDWLLLLTKTIGISLSGLLVAKQLGSKNALTDRLCRINSKTDCDGVLNSPAAKLWGWLSWADIGLLYFVGGLLTAMLSAIQLQSGLEMVRPLVNVLALLALPYTIFSVYYQARIVRQWCPLCLGVQGVLLIEGIIAVNQFSSLPDSWQPYAVLLFAFLLPTLAWVFVGPLLTEAAKNREEHNELQRFKRNPELFRLLLEQQPQMPAIPDEVRPIRLGKPDAKHTVTMVTNPYCGPCATMHKELEKLLSQNPNVKAEIIFAGDGIDGQATQMALHALSLAKQVDSAEALNKWYEQQEKNYDIWAARYPANINKIEAIKALDQHNHWCYLANLTSTPTVYVGGYKLPEIYSLSALRWLVEYLPTTAKKEDLAKSR